MFDPVRRNGGKLGRAPDIEDKSDEEVKALFASEYEEYRDRDKEEFK